MTRQAWLYFLVVAVLWGVPYFFIKVALHDLSPPVVVAARVAIAALVLLPPVLVSRDFSALRGRMRWVVAFALLEICAPFLLIGFGEQHITSSLTGILIATEPMFVTLMAFRFDPTERVGGRQLAGMVVGLIGVAVLLGLGAQGPGWLGGALMILGATACYAAGTLLIKHRLSDLSSVTVGAAGLGVSAVILAVPAAFTLPQTFPSGATVGAVLILSVACTSIAFIAFFALIGLAGARRATLITYVAPGVATLLGVLVAGDAFTPAIAAGLTLILGGSWYATASLAPPEGAHRLAPEVGMDG